MNAPISMFRKPRRAPVEPVSAPDWWPSHPDDAEAVLRALRGVELETIGPSAGGRPIRAATFGEPDMLSGQTSLSLAAARSAGDTSAFFGKGKRTRQHILFVGATHGTEFEGTVAMLNLLSAIINGTDLRGRKQPALHALKDRFRIVCIPFLNVDGRMRYENTRTFLPFDRDSYDAITMGVTTDGEIQRWPACKTLTPQPPEQFKQLGSYFNDNGMNLVYDDFFGQPQPETAALMALCRREIPDVVILSHTNHGSLVEHAVSYIPRHYQLRLAQLSGALARRAANDGWHGGMVAEPDPYCGQVFYQTDAIHHHCGALPLLMEFPCGDREPFESHEAILDLSMAALEETLIFGDIYGFRPPRD